MDIADPTAAFLDALLERAPAAQGAPAFLLAVSGGGDSMALLHAAAHWAERRRRRIASVSVDHGLSIASSEAAAFARDWAARLGIGDAALLRLTPPLAPGPALQARARQARHTALALAARDMGAPAILVGHTEDDLAETALMRARRGGGWRTLAAIGALDWSPVWPEGRGIHLARPLLNLRRAELRGWLAARGLTWRDDPANADARFERVRLRALLTGPDGEALRARTLSEARAARREAEAEDAKVRALLNQVAEFEPGGAIAAPRMALAEPGMRGRLLQALLAAAAGAPAPPPHRRAEALADQIAAQEQGRATLGGALATWSAATISLTRDPGALGRRDRLPPAPTPFGPTGRMIWDGRFEIEAGPGAAALAPLWTMPPHVIEDCFWRGAPGDPIALDQDGAPIGPALAQAGVRCLTRERALHALRPEPMSMSKGSPDKSKTCRHTASLG